MYTSNQILIVTGDRQEYLEAAIEFALKLADCKIEQMRGISSIDGRLFFGWIPKAQDDESKYDEKYIAKWQTTLTGSLIKPTMNVLIDIIYDWLESDEVKEIYSRLWEENDVGYFDTPTKGWKLTGFDDYTFAHMYGGKCPTFATFYIEPYWTEYLDEE